MKSHSLHGLLQIEALGHPTKEDLAMVSFQKTTGECCNCCYGCYLA
ncbi:MAG: hypothetical protein U0525_00670 [Patescibacteria group bacterium]